MKVLKFLYHKFMLKYHTILSDLYFSLSNGSAFSSHCVKAWVHECKIQELKYEDPI